MTLIEKIEIEGTKIMFYDGIDFDMAIGHSDDSEFLIFFVDSYVGVFIYSSYTFNLTIFFTNIIRFFFAIL